MTDTRTRRHGTELERAILDAAWAELTEVGYTALTIEAVAKRAGTSKPVIYRRWPSRAALVIASWAQRQPIQETVPDLGTLRADLLWLFTRVATRMDVMMSQTIAGVMAEAFKHPEVQELLRERLDSAPLTKSVWRIVDNAVARGELRPIALPRRVLRLPLDLLRSEAVICGSHLPEATLTALVDEVYIPLLKGLALD
ncbi:AcrR family transcriptional regulator [Kibdelosporangium banguiense]|uniref:AcrR family transcriptional regulator n=1 Tax=Kibdelosporangium banguiense TaxID=1365924 RepID=A0ABS4TQD3_9PSEU|nr:TetR/AcrR family transcriptional regulator [Kibdelosporangium banguiense]MBP2326620.1 AcrR family transcriptional regulator [Kibdelosporangium banguiense]